MVRSRREGIDKPVDPVGKARVHLRGVALVTGGDDQASRRIAPGELRHPARDAAADRREIVGEQQVGVMVGI